jgi:hypothetical protein
MRLSQSLRVDAPLSIIAPAVMWVARAVLEVHPLIPSASLTACRRIEVSAQVARPEVSQNLCW